MDEIQAGMTGMAKLNITWAGSNGDIPDPVPYDVTDAIVKQMAAEAVRGGYVPGIQADPNVDFVDFVVDRFVATAELPNRLFLRSKTPFGANSKTCEIHLPYFKQGDDLGHFLRTVGDVQQALEQDALMLEDSAVILRKVKDVLAKFPGKVEIKADTHMIFVDGDGEAIDALVAAEVAEIPEWLEDDYDCEEEE
jgi:hypothetical protein